MTDKEQEMLDKQLLDTVINGGTTEEVEQLIKKGANVNVKDSDGVSPLAYAMHHGTAEQVKMLVDAGADVHATDKFGLMPLDYATDMEKVEILRQAGAGKLNSAGRDNVAADMHKQRTVHDYQAKNSEGQASQAPKEEIAKPVKENKGKAVEFDMNKMPVRDGR